MIAIRDHPLAAAAMGVDTALYKSLTFGVSAMYAGIAGALGALLSAYVSPDSFPVFLSIKFLVGSVVGGIASISGVSSGHSSSSLCPISPIRYRRRARCDFRHVPDRFDVSHAEAGRRRPRLHRRQASASG